VRCFFFDLRRSCNSFLTACFQVPGSFAALSWRRDDRRTMVPIKRYIAANAQKNAITLGSKAERIKKAYNFSSPSVFIVSGFKTRNIKIRTIHASQKIQM
jgi:hypothetical protein